MPSNINPLNINGNYPIAGQDNDSQGFRDNFTNIRTNLSLAKSEIEDLQSKVLLKSSLGLSSAAPTNDMNYVQIYRPRLKSHAETFKDHGNISGAKTLSFEDGNFHKVSTAGPLTIVLADFPPSGIAGTMRLWLSIAQASGPSPVEVTLPNTVTLGRYDNVFGGETYDAVTPQITFTNPGNFLYEIITVDGGAAYWLVRIA